MKQLILFFFLMPFILKADGVQFQNGDFPAALNLAKKENKFIMMDAYATWCGPCKHMNKNIFPKDDVGAFYNENFISIKMDMESAEGKPIAERYEVENYPTFLFFSPNGELVHRSLGARSAEMIIADGQNALDPNKQLYTLEEKYANGDKAPILLKNYALAMENMGGRIDQITDVSNQYLSGLSDEQLKESDNLDFVWTMAMDRSGKAASIFEANIKDYEEEYGIDKVDSKVKYIASNMIRDAVELENPAVLGDAMQYVYNTRGDRASAINGMLKMKYFAGVEQWNNYATVAMKHVSKYGIQDWQSLNDAAWRFYEHIDNLEHLNKAMQWAKISMGLDKNFYNTDTMAALMYKTGNMQGAMEMAQVAVQLAKEEGIHPKETLELIEKIREQAEK